MKAVIRTPEGLMRFVRKVAKSDILRTGKPYTVSLARFYRPKTLEQNAKYHAMIADIAVHIGYSNSEVKDYVKAEFGPVDTITIAGKTKSIPKSVSKYTVQEMSAAIETLYRVGADAGVEWHDAEL